MQKIMQDLGTSIDKVEDDERINQYGAYWNVLDQNEDEISSRLGVPLESILYSKYYWCTKYKERYNQLYGFDAGLEDQQCNMLPEIQYKLGENTDWDLLEKIDSNKIE